MEEGSADIEDPDETFTLAMKNMPLPPSFPQALLPFSDPSVESKKASLRWIDFMYVV